MKIIVATLAFGDLPYFMFSERINRKYCNLYGYDFRVLTQTEEKMNRSPCWLKVNGVRALLQHADFVLFLDADAYFIDHQKTIESLISEHMDDAAVLVGTDRRDREFAWSDRNANTGVFVVRNCAEGFAVLREWWDAPIQYDARWLWRWPPEQGAFNYIVIPLFPSSIIKIIRYDFINGWDGQFVRHLIGVPNNQRLHILENEAVRLQAFSTE
jgi:Nucleotide-diphospho-sugar transferase